MTRSALALLAGLIAMGGAQAQSSDARWPERPIRLIVPFTAGSSSDIVARIVASGNVGTEATARAEADGYTFGVANTSTHAVSASLATLAYDPIRDFAPVSMLGSSPFVLALYPGVPARSVQDLVALAKAQPRVLNYASAGPATLELLAGRVEMQFGTIPPTLTHIRAGKLRALAVTGAARNAALPDVPTIAESGLPGYECTLWQAMVAPAGTPAAIVARLNREVTAVLEDPEVRATFAKNGVEPEPGPPAALGARIRAELAKWREVISSTGIRAN